LHILKHVKVTRIETRPVDTWFDLSLRQLRDGEVNFYSVQDFLTGKWLFKTCSDRELGKVLVKAVKCPPGTRLAQLEGNSMVFQHSVVEDMLYDVISLTQADENDKLSRKVIQSTEDVPAIIKENYKIKSYEEATGKTAPGKRLVTLSEMTDQKTMITLFLLERAWPLSKITPEEKLESLREQEKPKARERKEIDTGQIWKCPICGDEFQLKHIEKELSIKHALKKT
jgi:hypothetical protein